MMNATIAIHMSNNPLLGAGAAAGNTAANTATTDNASSNMSSTTTTSGKKANQEPLFGPNIGLVSSGPSWAVTHEKKVVTDDLTPDVVKGWVEKSKLASQPTTTLQALVNLKRPSLRLSPLSPETAEPGSPILTDNTATDDQHALSFLQLHGLEFEYDCDAPKCGIYVHVLVPKDHPEASATVSPTGFSKILVFETVTEGGFSRLLKLEDGAILELGRYEQGRKAKPASSSSAAASMSAEAISSSSSDPARLTAGVSSPGITEVLASGNETGNNNTNNNSNNNNGRVRKRFSGFPFRKKFSSHARSVSGPALPVVDMGQEQQAAPEDHDATGASAPAAASDGGSTATSGQRTTRSAEARGRKKDRDDGQGVRVLIRLAALDELGTELMSPNEQVTYLHIVRFGTKDPAVEDAAAEDTRPWVVKVVKREATIGPHTFQLHEIYGLTSSSSTHSPIPTAPLPNQEHSYPPEAVPSTGLPGGSEAGVDDVPQSECLLCLCAPREVVLLPCRHLVACRECALNMVEFGAGGQITQSNDDSGAMGTSEGGGVEGGAGGATGVGGEGGANGTNAAGTRRRRKAKGWYCPVCRQPYTSLLRITTQPPAPEKTAGVVSDSRQQGDPDIAVRQTAEGVQNMDIADHPLTNAEDANEASRNAASGIGRMFRLGRRSANASAADENV